MASSTDPVENFFVSAETICTDAQFVIDSLPNADRFAAERSLRQLSAIQIVLGGMDDPHTSPERIVLLLNYVAGLYAVLDEYLASPPLTTSAHRENAPRTGRKGRPRLVLNLDRALELHSMGNSWEAVSKTLGVARKTMYNHLAHHGLSAARPPHTVISDEDLDEAVSEISLQHPFAGSTIVRGHLASRGIIVSAERIQDSLRRVDLLGVLVR
jgi:hypothetical protein